MPVPEDAPLEPARHPRLGLPSLRVKYRDADGFLQFEIYRFDLPDQGKVFLPLSLWRDADGALEWRWTGVPAPRPLYRLHWLAANPDFPAIVCEGEKSAHEAWRIFSDFIATTSPGGAQAAAKADWSPLAGRRVTIWPDADEPGAKYAAQVAGILHGLGCDVSIIDAMALASMTPDGDAREPEPGWDAADAIAEWGDKEALRQAALGLAKAFDADDKADGDATEAPRPLRRQLSPAQPFPISALGQVLGAATRAIIDKVQCPDAIAAGSVLAAASLAVQAYADVVLPATGRARPASLYLCTVAASGDRKSAADYEALTPIRAREEALREAYEAELPGYRRAKRAFEVATAQAEKANAKAGRQQIEAALRAVGDEPLPPLTPLLTCGEPTLEGLHKLFAVGHPALGLFSDEGGSFIGGHAMSDENRLRTVAGLSSLWDGAPIKRVRAGDGASVLAGRRLALHLMAQPDAAARMLSDSMLVDQGFLTRLLVAAPQSAAGTRLQRGLKPETERALRRYGARLLAILETPPTLMAGTRNAVEPRRLEFDEAAKATWLAFADRVEKLLAPGGRLEPIRGFANKLPEHAARIAGVLHYVNDQRCGSISRITLRRAIKIAVFFANEALRLGQAGSCSPELREAEKLLAWLKTWKEPLIGLRSIYRLGPNSIRDAKTAKAAVAILEDHGWLQRHDGLDPVVDGQPVREAWRIVSEA
ncbi:MAG TPA: DUF3987 domain-containing protein [Methylocystis sp.]|jgi:hypothetical protein